MNAEHAEQIVRRMMGYWPTPAISDEEAVAWVQELTNPALAVTPTEALSVIRKASYAGEPHRPRPGQLVAAVQAERRALGRVEDTRRALTAGREGAVSGERASAWARACRRMLEGVSPDEAKAAEGLVG